MKSFFVLFAMVFSLSVGISGQRRPIPLVQANQNDLMALVNNLLQAVKPDAPQNAYMPQFMKDKISWVFTKSEERKNKTGKDMLAVVLDPTRHWGEALMFASYGTDSLPLIGIVGDNIFRMVGIDSRPTMGLSQTHKNTFGIALVHEAVHKFVVQPLIETGQPMSFMFTDVHKLLVACQYKTPCREVTDVFRKGIVRN